MGRARGSIAGKVQVLRYAQDDSKRKYGHGTSIALGGGLRLPSVQGEPPHPYANSTPAVVLVLRWLLATPWYYESGVRTDVGW